MKNALLLAALASTPLICACSQSSTEAGDSAGKLSVEQAPFGETAGKQVKIFTLRNENGMEVQIISYGGRIKSIMVPDKKGKMGDVVLGWDDLEGFLQDNPYLGALIGRYGNRIGDGTFALDGKRYDLPQNDNGNTLHGGPQGFDKRVWTGEPIEPNGDRVGLHLHYTSADQEMGFPGKLETDVNYFLTNDNELVIEYHATTDKPTVVNLTNHAYFNLAGSDSILDHELVLEADSITPVDEGLIPTGEFTQVKGTPFDFTTPHAIGERINADNVQLKRAGGYDHNWVLNKGVTDQPEMVGKLVDPSSGRAMEVYTTEPGIQFYSGNFLDGTLKGKEGKSYVKRSALCLETQHYPDSPNHDNFPSTVLRPGDEYQSTTIYKFTVQK